MNVSTPSPTTDLNKVIENFNPFDRPLVVRSHDVWEQHFPDVPSINAHISNAVFQGIEQIRNKQRSVLGLTIRAEKGLGKSHLISRIRQHLIREDDCFFVYMSEVDYGDLNSINSQFLGTLSFSLKQKGGQGVTQWQELAAVLVNQVYKSTAPAQEIVNRFPGAVAKNPSLVDSLTTKICQIIPEIQDPYIVQAILWTLSPSKGIFAVNWLSGKDLAQTQANALGLPASHDGDKEARALNLASQILDLVGNYRTVVICFDEVEPKNCSAQGLTTPQVVSLLAKDLYSKLKRGILIMAIFPQTWAHQVKALPQAESVTDRIGEKVLDLKYLNSDDIVALVSQWLKAFYDEKGLTPYHAVYPFDESQLRELGKEKPIIRQVLKWCSENWKVGDSASSQLSELHHEVEIAFNEQLKAIEKNLSSFLENSTLIAEALRLGFVALSGETVTLRNCKDAELGEFRIKQVDEIQAKNADKGYLQFKVVGKENGALTKIGVAVVQESGNRYVSAALKRLIDYQKFDMTRGCLVRAKAVKDGTKGADYLNTLLNQLGGEWVLLTDQHIKPLLAILMVYKAYEDYELTEEKVIQFIKHRKIAENNYLLNEILSDPSGQVPNGVIDEDSILLAEPEIDASMNKSEASIDDLLVALSS